MGYSKITITFNSEVALDEYVCFKVRSIDNPTLELTWHEQFKNNRLRIGQVPIVTPTAIAGEISAIFYLKSINLDYNPDATYYTTSRVDNVVTIIAPISDLEFVTTGLSHTQSSNITVLVENINPASIFNFSSIVFSEATTNTKCTHYKVTVTTSVLATDITSPVDVTGNTDNPFVFEVLRSVPLRIECNTSDGQNLVKLYTQSQVPNVINSSNINIGISGSPNGATVTASVAQQDISINTLQYSLDGTTYQTSNAFPGLADGDFTMYVKDAFGCVVTIAFNVNGNNVVNPHFYMSKSMSIPFVERVTYGDCGPYKNDDNTLSSESLAKLVYEEIWQFQSCDVRPIQFESNYATNIIKVIKEDGNTDTLTVAPQTNFIGIKDSRDAIKYNIGNGKSGIYFTSGNLYDYDSGIDTGTDYLLNGGLPEWGKISNYINVDNAWFQITNVIFDESVNAEVLVIDLVYTGVPLTVKTKSKFNRQLYEVYEFVIDMSAYNNQTIQVSIDLQDPNFPNKVHISEKILVKTRHENTVEIIYYNEGNTDVYYKTGIKNLIRLPIDNIEGDHDDPSENLKADANATLLSSTVYEMDLFVFQPATKGAYRQILQALSHKFITINGVAYIKNGGIEKEGPLEDSNLYIIRAKMLRTSIPYSSNITGGEVDLLDTEEILEVPHLQIDGDGNFMGY